MGQKSDFEQQRLQRRRRRRQQQRQIKRRFVVPTVPVVTACACFLSTLSLFIWNACSTRWRKEHGNYSRSLLLDYPSTHHLSFFHFTRRNHTYSLWDETTDSESLLPGWYEDYVIWHRDTLKQLHRDNWKEFRYLLIRCVVRDRVCGGAADRLRPLPAILYLASRARRLVFIYWTRPAPLEEFLIPNQIDWRLPIWLVPYLKADTPRLPWSFVLDQVQDGDWDRRRERLISIRTLYHGVLDYYDSVNAVPLKVSYHAIWTATFQPSPPVFQRIQSAMSELHLTTNQYVGLHIRSLYQINTTMDHDELEHAVHCAATTTATTTTTTASTTTTFVNNDSVPIFVASDAPSSTRYAVQYGITSLGLAMTHLNQTGTLHLDRGQDFLQTSRDWQNHKVEEYYTIFVELYILSASRCVTAGIGGYGVWASAIGQHPECFLLYKEIQQQQQQQR